VTRKKYRVGAGRHDQPVALEATGDEAKSEAQSLGDQGGPIWIPALVDKDVGWRMALGKLAALVEANPATINSDFG